MTSVRLPYVRRKRGNLFWEPTPQMRAKGFLPKPLGPEGPDSIAAARRLYEAWLKVLAAPDRRVSSWPSGSLGHFYDRMRLTAAWAKKKPRTREGYERAWKHLGALSSTTITRITVDDCERLADAIQAEHGSHQRYHTLKNLRAILSDAIYRLKLTGYPNPAKAFPNPAPSGRSAIWLGAEVALLITTAEATGYGGMAIAIRVAWDTLFSPIDVWTITRAQVRRDATGAYVERDRAKTGRDCYGHLTAATELAVDAYIAALGFEIPAEGRLIRQRNGHAYRSKDTFGDDFRAVRLAAFGPEERRQFQDLRRSGNVEADAAGADKSTMAEILANSMDRSSFLDVTYTPPTVAKAREVAALRLLGRNKLAGELMRRRET